MGARDTIIGRIEDGIIRELKAALPSAAYIAAFPDDPRDFDMAQYDLAALVHYAGSRFANDGLSAAADQGRDMRIAVLLYVRALRGVGGAYEVLEDIRRALQNRRFAGAHPARITADQLAGEEGGVWRWEMEVSVPVLAVAAQVAPRTGGPMQFEER